MIITDRFVDFARYCKTCKYEELEEVDSPCAECLEHPVNTNSQKPFCYAEKETRPIKLDVKSTSD